MAVKPISNCDPRRGKQSGTEYCFVTPFFAFWGGERIAHCRSRDGSEPPSVMRIDSVSVDLVRTLGRGITTKRRLDNPWQSQEAQFVQRH
jgi:hypothetical protein